MNRADFTNFRWLTGVSVVGVAAGIFAPVALAQDVQWLQLNGLPQVSAGVDVEGSTEQTRLNSGTSTYEHVWVAPLVGLHSTGSIYHPNLLTFDLSGDLGWNWDTMTTSGGGAGQTQNQNAELLRYFARFDFLANKNYKASAYAEQDHTYRDYGSFNTYLVDANRYGGNLSWKERDFIVNADVGYRDETASGLTDSSEISETFLNFLGIQKRKSGQTSLVFHADDMSNTVNNGNHYETRSWSAGISDSETFGRRRQINLGSSLTYGQSDYSGQQMDTLNVSDNLSVNHTPQLGSYLMFNFDRHELGSQTTSDRLQGSAGVRHQLYESLGSNLEGHGSHQADQAGGGGNSTLDLYGVNLNENYTKRLQSWGRLSVGAGVFVDHQEQNSSGGMVLTPAETHSLFSPSSPEYLQPVYLSRPQIVASSIQVIQVNGSACTLVRGTDFQANPVGELTEVKLLNTAVVNSLISGSGTNNIAVTFSYQSQTLPNSAYETFGGNVSVRLDLWNNLGFYGRFNLLDNNAPLATLTQTLTDLIGGVDYRRQWLRAGAEVEDYDSSFTRYQALRLFQNFDFTLNESSTLGFDCSQSFYTYPGAGEQSQYQFMAHYSTRLPLALTWYLDAGAMDQEISSMQQLQGLARTGITWSRGKLSLRAGYEFNGQSTGSGGFTEERTRHFFFTYLRRSF